jgi:predicted RNA-binding Zn-ribbon protein involved in translation (DUF1610 family)
MTDGNIQAARTKLTEAVDRLTKPRMAVYHDKTCWALSLYRQLQADLAGTQGDSRTPAKSLPPLWIDAVQLLGDMDSETRAWYPKERGVPARLGALSATSWRPQDTDKVTAIASTVEAWCETIINLIDPKAQMHITAPCPSCGKAIVYRRDSGGDLVRQEALKWTPNAGFQCQACKASWSPEQTLFFAKLLGIDLPSGVLE